MKLQLSVFATIFALIPGVKFTSAAPVLTFQDTLGDPSSVSVVPGGSFSFNVSLNSGTTSFSGLSYFLQASTAGKTSVTNQVAAGGNPMSDPERIFSLPITLSTSASGDFGYSTANNSNVAAGTYAIDAVSFSMASNTSPGTYTVSSSAGSGVATTNGQSVSFTNLGSAATYTINVLAASTWSGAAGGGLWSSAGNWDAQPVNGTNIFFAGSGAAPAPTNDSYLTSVGSITFNNGAASFTLGGTGGGASVSIPGGITNNSTSNQTINLGLTLAAPQQFNAASGNLTVNGAIATGGNALTVTGSSNTTLAGAISQAGAVTKTGAGTLTLSGNSSYSGGTTVTAGKLVVSHAIALGSGGLSISNSATVQLATGLTSPVQLPSLTISGSSVVADLDGANSLQAGSFDSGGMLDASLTDQASAANPVPEPNSIVVLVLGGLILLGFSMRRDSHSMRVST